MTFVSGFEKIVRLNEPLAPHTWFHLGGPAEYFAEPNNADELAALGGGSNVLVRDQGVPGVVIHLSAPAFADIIVGKQTVSAGAGAKLGHLISTSVREGLA